jgi:sensor histidine kinase YesM
VTRRWRGWALFAVAWVPAVIGYTEFLERRRDVPLGAAFASASVYVIAAALLGALVWRGSARITWPDRRPYTSFALAQVAMALVFSTLWYVVIVGYLTTRLGVAPAMRVSETFAVRQILIGLWLYGLIAGISHALRLTGRRREREAAAARAESLHMHAELQALRGQLDPPFLFNTLRAVSALVPRDPAGAQVALEHFADLLRYVLDAKRLVREEVTLAEELSFVRDYLVLEQLRFGERLTVVEQIDADALECVLPSLTLQPLVENAITHAIAPRATGGTITIGASIEGDELILVVADDGPGAVEEGVRSAQGLGLRVGRQRLETRYPKLARFTVTTAPGAGFTVTLTLPAQVLVSSTDRVAVPIG